MRIAATGGIRPACTAGASVAAIVTPTPTSSATTTVRPAMIVPACGNPAPPALKIAVSASDTPTPPSSPIAVASRAITNDSPSTIVRTCRPLAPMARSSASSRTRWPTMIRNVLLIRNALTNSAISAKPSSTHRNSSTALPIRSAVSRTTVSPVTTSSSGGSSGSMARCTSSAEPGSTATSIES
ncbi:unannotated protein [freshwater metagenome]|uniref:Unannotated protein n=1 Tax=freshwater metagenome TaxID=449393 RepID=A0A6J6FVB0_9ZZZZ